MESRNFGSGSGASGATRDQGRVVMDTDRDGIRKSRPSGPHPTDIPQGGARLLGGEDHRGFADGPGPQVLGASSLEGNKVVNMENEHLGEIKEIMIDVQSGRVAYAVLSFGGLLSMGEKLFALPWSALSLDADKQCFILNVDKKRLKDAPGFDKDNWPAMADPQWASGVHSYYDKPPYWK